MLFSFLRETDHKGSKSRSSWAILWSARVSYDTEKSVPSQAKPRQGSNPQEERGSVSFDPLAYFDFYLLGSTSADVVLGSEVRLLVTRNSDMVGWDLASETLNSDETRNSD